MKKSQIWNVWTGSVKPRKNLEKKKGLRQKEKKREGENKRKKKREKMTTTKRERWRRRE